MTFRETALCAALVLAGCSHPKSDASPATDDTSTPSSTASLAGNVAMGADALFRDDAAVVEGFDEGTAAFTIAPDGAVKVAVADAAGKPVSVSDRKATLKYSILETGKTVEVPLQPDADKHYLVATGPELADVVTPVKYEITGGARPWTGILQIPAGGTKALNASAQVAADAHAAPIVGPHGGHIERVGKDDVELLLDKDSGETRAWIIVDGKAVEPNDRELVVLIDDKRVKLRADRNMSFYGKVKPELGLHLDAIHKVSCELTVGVGASAKVNTVLFGMRPHVLVYAPRVIVDIEGRRLDQDEARQVGPPPRGRRRRFRASPPPPRRRRRRRRPRRPREAPRPP